MHALCVCYLEKNKRMQTEKDGQAAKINQDVKMIHVTGLPTSAAAVFPIHLNGHTT